MQSDAEAGSLPCAAALRQQGRHDTGEQVAHAAARHPGVAPRTDVQTSIRIGDKTAGALQHDDRGMTPGQFAHRGETIFLDGGGGHP